MHGRYSRSGTGGFPSGYSGTGGYTGSRYTGSGYTGSRYTGSGYTGSRYSGTGGYTGSRYDDDESRRIQQEKASDCVECGIELIARNIQTKQSYKKSLLKYHPDKSSNVVGVDNHDVKYYQDSFRKIDRCFKKFYNHPDLEGSIGEDNQVITGGESPCDSNMINNIKTYNREGINQRSEEIQNNPSEQKLFAKIYEKERKERERRNLSQERKETERRNLSQERKERERRNLSQERKETERRNLSQEKKKRKLEASIKQKQADEEYENNQERIKNKINSQAATKIQNIIRRSQAIKKRKVLEEQKRTKTSKERKAATKIQNIIRRSQARKVLGEQKRQEKIKIERPITITKQYDKILKDVIKSAKNKNKRNLSYKSNARKMAEIAIEAANVGKNKSKNIVLNPRKNSKKRKKSQESISTLLEKMTIREKNSNSETKSPKRKKQRK